MSPQSTAIAESTQASYCTSNMSLDEAKPPIRRQTKKREKGDDTKAAEKRSSQNRLTHNARLAYYSLN